MSTANPPTPVGAVDPAQTLAFLRELSDPLVGCVELRVFRARYERGFVVPSNYASTLAGWYDNFDDLLVDARRLKGVSGYVTVNPVTRDLLARSDNRLTQVKHATADVDILCVRWLYIDIDPVRRPDISSTSVELAMALSRRDEILEDFSEIRASAIWGCSGNGAFILARLDDLPNDKITHEHIVRITGRLADRYSDNVVVVDRKTTNPARVCLVPGLQKCKGSNRPERPWRLATVDGGLMR